MRQTSPHSHACPCEYVRKKSHVAPTLHSPTWRRSPFPSCLNQQQIYTPASRPVGNWPITTTSINFFFFCSFPTHLILALALSVSFSVHIQRTSCSPRHAAPCRSAGDNLTSAPTTSIITLFAFSRTTLSHTCFSYLLCVRIPFIFVLLIMYTRDDFIIIFMIVQQKR